MASDGGIARCDETTNCNDGSQNSDHQGDCCQNKQGDHAHERHACGVANVDSEPDAVAFFYPHPRIFVVFIEDAPSPLEKLVRQHS